MAIHFGTLGSIPPSTARRSSQKANLVMSLTYYNYVVVPFICTTLCEVHFLYSAHLLLNQVSFCIWIPAPLTLFYPLQLPRLPPSLGPVPVVFPALNSLLSDAHLIHSPTNSSSVTSQESLPKPL